MDTQVRLIRLIQWTYSLELSSLGNGTLTLFSLQNNIYILFWNFNAFRMSNSIQDVILSFRIDL